MLVYFNDCCGVVTLQTGTYIIHFINWVAAFLGFVPWVSMGVNIARDLDWRLEEGTPTPIEYILMYIVIGIGALCSVLRTIMAVVLNKSLHKEESRYARWYIIIGLGLNALNIPVIGLCVALRDLSLALITIGILCMDSYFLVVIYNAYRNMVLAEEKAKAASQVNA